jgi:hypothetical protein
MSVKILILKSLEDVVADVKEMLSGEKVVGYILNNPYVVSIKEGEQTQVGFYPYAPLSKDNAIPIPCDWVVSIVEPLEEVKQSYLEQVNAKSKGTDSQE